MLVTYWSSELSQLQELQKREYREWVTNVHEDMVRATTGLTNQFHSFLRPIFVLDAPVQSL